MAHILIAEDAPEILHAYSAILKGAGHSCTTAMNGLEAKLYLNVDKYDLVLTDLLMPKMDGIELASYIHGLANRPKLLVVTGGGERLSAYEAIKLGDSFFDASLMKPVSATDLLCVIERLLQ
jgi:DNA-binding NtrC family response regulator